jgi:uncharacterized protein YuzB (UPF0349 family)
MFSTGFLTVLVYGSLIWCAISSTALLAMLVQDLLKGSTW